MDTNLHCQSWVLTLTLAFMSLNYNFDLLFQTHGFVLMT